MQKILLVICLFVSGMALAVNDTIYDTIVVTHPVDTLRVEAAVTSSDLLLLDLLSQQTLNKREQDSLRQIEDSLRLVAEALRRDSLLQELNRRDAELVALIKSIQDSLQLIHDSINILRADEIAQQAYEDSVRIATLRMDSITKEISQLKETPGIKMTRSLISDPEEDLKEMKAQKKNIFNPWRKEANIQLQFSQSYISPNWYQGGTKLNIMLLGIAKGTINYRKNRISWENLAEWRAGVVNAPNDTLRTFNVNDDQFRFYTKFGYSLVKTLYLSTSAEVKMPFFNTWNANQSVMKTTFMTPTRFNMGLGLDYQPVSGLSIALSPATYQMLYALRIDDKVNEESFGLKKDTHIMHDGGSSLRVKWKWVPVREVVLETELYAFTNYGKHHEVNLTVDCTFIINRFLTTRVSLHPRYNTMEDKKKIQFKELVSIGFAHKFR